jgi:hypothetical protein
MPQSRIDIFSGSAMQNSVSYNSKLKTENLLTRFEFMEVLLRMALARFYVPKLNEVETPAEAV